MPGVNVPAVKVNTVGYERSWRKIAIFNVEPTGAVVKDASSGRIVLAIQPGQVVARGRDAASLDPVWQVDFTDLVQRGRYRLVGGGAESDAFEIGDGVYLNAVLAGEKSFYFQRCRTDLTLPYARWKDQSYTRPAACHAHAEVGWDDRDYPVKKRRFQLKGGWHDAGNYDMYVPSTAVALQTLLFAYEWAPSRFRDGDLNIPESSNRIPDLLDEARHALIWLLSLQEPSGAFRHSETVTDWTPQLTPDKDRSVRWVAGRSSSATAKAVAVLAQASRLFGKWDTAFSRRCATAARGGWRFLRGHPQHVRAVRKVGTQSLWDDDPKHNDQGARLAAAAEMWRAFRVPEALASARQLLDTAEEARDPQKILEGAWANISRFPLWTLARDEAAPGRTRAQAKERLIAAAEMLRSRVENSDGYRCASSPEDYFWGSNSNLMEKLVVVAMAARLSAHPAGLVEMARDQWHWILGRNPNGYSMVTRVGKGPDRFYHTEWGSHEPPPPGFLIGGPNSHDAGWLAPGAPAKALLWDNPQKLRSGLPPHSLWHWQQSDLWEGGFVKDGGWDSGWWALTESDILYSANFVAAGTVLLDLEP